MAKRTEVKEWNTTDYGYEAARQFCHDVQNTIDGNALFADLMDGHTMVFGGRLELKMDDSPRHPESEPVIRIVVTYLED